MSNRPYTDYSEDPNRWIVSYADFTTMLLALFIVLYAVSQLDIAQMREFTSSVKKSFSSLEVNNKNKRKSLNAIFSTSKARIKTIPIEFTFQEQIENLKKKLKETESKVSEDMSELDSIKGVLLENLPENDNISMTHTERGLVISLEDTVLFDPGSAEIKKEALITLEKIAEILKTIPNSVRIEGHTDDQPIQTQLFPTNWELSTARAISIVKLFIKDYDFLPQKISAAGYGQHKPLDTNTTPEGRQKNRRVDIVVLSMGSQIFEPKVNN